MARLLVSIEKVMKGMIILLIGFMLFWVFVQVVTRYCFDYTPSFGEELARYIFVWVVFLCLPIVARSGGHMAVEFVTVRVKGQMLRTITIVADVCTSVFLVIMIKGGMEMVVSMSYQTAPALQIPMSYIYIVIPFGCLIMFVNTLAHLVTVIRTPASSMK